MTARRGTGSTAASAGRSRLLRKARRRFQLQCRPQCMRGTSAITPVRLLERSTRRCRGIGGRTKLVKRSPCPQNCSIRRCSIDERSRVILLCNDRTSRRSRGCLSPRLADAVVVLVVPPYPVRQVEIGTVLVAALGRQVEEHVSAEPALIAASIRRIRMEDGTVVIFEKHAGAVKVLHRSVDHFIVVVDLALGHVVFGETHVIIVVEVAAVGRYPVEAPTHALFVRFDFSERCARDRDEGYIVMCDMLIGTIDMVGKERASQASRLPTGTEHEVINDQLAAPVEEIGERLLAIGRVEYILLLDL